MTLSRRTSSRALALIGAVLVTACSGDAPEQPQTEPTAEGDASAATSPAPARISAYTSLADCPVLESNPDEAGYYLSECAGLGGYKLRISESDLRQSVEVIAPSGVGQGLNLAAVTGGGFSNLGKNAEWRGASASGALVPDALILRHEVVTDPDGMNTVSYLVVVRLTGTPCVIARVEPGPQQNAGARTAADAKGPCLS